jgi:hypothetical protein
LRNGLKRTYPKLLNFNYQLSGLNGDGAGASAAGAAGAATFGAEFFEDFFFEDFFLVTLRFAVFFLEDFFTDFFFDTLRFELFLLELFFDFLRAATYPPYGVELLPIFSHYIHQNIQSVPTFL